MSFLNISAEKIGKLNEILEITKKTLDSSISVRKKMNEPKETIKTLSFTLNLSKNLMMDLLDLAQLENSTFSLN